MSAMRAPEHQPSQEIKNALLEIPRLVAGMARGKLEPKYGVCPLATGTGKSAILGTANQAIASVAS